MRSGRERDVMMAGRSVLRRAAQMVDMTVERSVDMTVVQWVRKKVE